MARKFSLIHVALLSGLSIAIVIGLELLVWRAGYHRQVQYALYKIGLAPGRDVYTPMLADAEAAEQARQAYEHIIARRNAELPAQQQQEIMKLYSRLGIWKNMWWLGVRIQKNPCDMWMMQQVLFETKPDYIIEAGTLCGGSALYFAQMLDGMGLEQSKVITIDIEDHCQETARLPLWRKKVEFIHGSSTDPQIVAQIGERVKGKKVLVVLDSNHSRDHVYQELLSYGPMVTPASYLVVEDTNIDAVPTDPKFGPGPMAAVNDFLKTELGQTFTQDLTREAMILTFNPGGWLKKD